MKSPAADLSARLSHYAEDVCRTYLSNGKRAGNYWIVGDITNTPGRSLFVRLNGPESGPGAAGHWTDAATGEHGDLLDIMRHACGFHTLSDVLTEARRFLSLPAKPAKSLSRSPSGQTRRNSARRLFKMASPLRGTIAEHYLASRALAGFLDEPALRFHPSCYYREDEDAPLTTWPALLAAVTDLSGTITGVQRSWLTPPGVKAPLPDPRRAMGELQGHAVRFGSPGIALIAGEGIETLLSLRTLYPHIPAAAALTANHLAMMILPPGLKRLYIAQDNDPAGARASERLSAIAAQVDIAIQMLVPLTDDWNTDLLTWGADPLRRRTRPLFHPADLT